MTISWHSIILLILLHIPFPWSVMWCDLFGQSPYLDFVIWGWERRDLVSWIIEPYFYSSDKAWKRHERVSWKGKEKPWWRKREFWWHQEGLIAVQAVHYTILKTAGYGSTATRWIVCLSRQLSSRGQYVSPGSGAFLYLAQNCWRSSCCAVAGSWALSPCNIWWNLFSW